VITVQEHLMRIVETVQRLPATGLDLLDAQGCVLARDVITQVALPGFRNSGMDGYAVRAADLAGAGETAPVTLPVAGDIAGGNTEALTLAPGQSMRIMTGAPMPDGADAVVPVEHTDGGVSTVTVSATVPAGQHVRQAGGDVAVGNLVMSAGTRLGPRQIALLAPALPLMAARPQQETPLVTALASHDWAAPAGKVPFARIVLSRNGSGHQPGDSPGYSATIAGPEGSHALGSLAAANALAVIPAEVTSVGVGDPVSCHLLGPILEAS
jgi:molybdopterin molybdotransferase